jgi:prophage antirepressor-like protein
MMRLSHKFSSGAAFAAADTTNEKGAQLRHLFRIPKEEFNMQQNPALNPVALQATASAIGTAEFTFQNHPIRIFTVNGQTLFVAKDIAPILGFRNARQAVRTHVSRRDRDAVQIVDTMGREQTVLAVNESGLYALILGSTKPQARRFKDWVTGEVLPAVRKTGEYRLKTVPAPLLAQITALLRGRGVAKERQLNRVIAHRDGTFSFRVGKRWVRRVTSLEGCDGPCSHTLREGLALGAFTVGQTAGLLQ